MRRKNGASSCHFLPCFAIPGVLTFLLFHLLPSGFHYAAPFCPFFHNFSQRSKDLYKFEGHTNKVTWIRKRPNLHSCLNTPFAKGDRKALNTGHIAHRVCVHINVCGEWSALLWATSTSRHFNNRNWDYSLLLCSNLSRGKVWQQPMNYKPNVLQIYLFVGVFFIREMPV